MAERNSLSKKIKLDKEPSGSKKRESTTGIKALPEEMLIFVFKKMSLHDSVMNCSQTCVQWKDIVAVGILQQEMSKLVIKDPIFKKDIKGDGWSEECQDSKLILSLYPKYQKYASMLKILLLIQCLT